MELDQILNSIGEDGTMATPPPAPETPPAPEATPPAGTDGAAPPPDPAAPAAPEGTSPPAAPAAPETTPAPVVPDKANAAFAAMRTQNTQFKRAMDKMALSVGLERGTMDDEAFYNALNDKLTESVAAKQNVSPELLKRLEIAEANQALFLAEQNKALAFQGFQKVKTTFGLNDTDLQTFAKQLDDQGVDPFTSQIDLVGAYKVLNFDAIMEKTKKDAVAAALGRQENAVQHGTKPVTHTAPVVTPAPAAKVDTVAGLNDFLAKLGK